MHKSIRVSLIALIGLLAPVALSASPGSAAPAVPVLTAPIAGAVTTSNPQLAWNPVSAAVKYEVQVSDTSDFAAGTVRFTESTANTYSTPPNDLAVNDYWWRVRTVDASGAVSGYATRTFSKQTADAPVTRTPLDGAALQYPGQPVILSWDPLAGAKSYEVQIDDDPAFVGAPAAVSTANNSYTPVNPPFNTPVYWRVRAKSSQAVPTQYSNPWSYTLSWDETAAGLNDVPLLLAPADEASVEEIALDWEPLRGAASYELQISPDEFFNAPIGGTRVVNSTSFSPSPTLPAGSYYWRVRGMSTTTVAEPSQWSEIRLFTRAWPNASAATRPRGTADNRHNQVELLLPTDADYSLLTEPTLSWKPQREASHYEVWAGPDANFSPNTYSTCLTNRTVLTPYNVCPMPRITPGAVIYWKVRAVDGPAAPGVYGVFSTQRSFLYDPLKVNQTAPAAGAVVQVPVLTWDPVDNISRYRVTIAPVTTTPGCGTVTADTYNTTYVPQTLAAQCTGALRWTVQSVEDDNQASRLADTSSWPTFTIAPATAQASMGPIVKTPGDAVRPPLLTWNRVTSATSYIVRFSVSGANSFAAAHVSTNQPGFAYTGQQTSLAPVLTPGAYDYYVQAFSAAGALLDTSAIGTFQIGAWPASTVVSPASCTGATGGLCTLHDTPTLDWEAIPNIGLYHVYLATDPNFTNITRDWTTVYSELTPVESLADSQAGQAYYWYARPCFTATSCAPFNATVFGRAGAFRKVSLPVQALTPKVGNPSGPVADEVTFTWTDYLTTNHPLNGTLPSGSTIPEVVTQEARSYVVQVSTTAEFTNIIETSPMIDQTSYTAQTATYPEGPLFWRVRAYDNSGNPLTNSCGPTASGLQPACSDFGFVKTSAAPQVVAPAVGSTVNSTPTLVWKPLPFAKSYDVEIYTNPDAALNPANRVVGFNTRTTATIANTQLAKGTYGWRVRRLDATARPGSWSAETNTGLFRFTVGGPAVTLGTPTAGASVAYNKVSLQWIPVAGASRYRVDVSRDNFATTLDTMTTDMATWAPDLLTPKWPTGAYQWRVATLDATGRVLATSAVRAFTLIGPPVVERWSGPDRFSASAAISAKSFPVGVNVAYIASGLNFPDALSGAPVAGLTGGPVLLSRTDSIDVPITTELTRLKPKKIVILGGPGSVSDGVRVKLDAYTTGAVERWFGPDRFSASAAISARSFPVGVNVAYVASGLNFPDALSGAPVAGMTQGPVLLSRTDSIDVPITDELTRLKPTKIVILGGPGSVSDGVRAKLDAYTTGAVERWFGPDRFSASAAISARSFPVGVNVAYIASGLNFPDALSGAPVAGMTGGPVLLSRKDSLDKPITDELTRLKPKKIVILGGPGSVSDQVKAQLQVYLS